MTTQPLEAQSDAQRHEIEDTLGELKRRLTPGQLVDEVLAYTKDGGGEFFSNLGRQATANPMPVTLIGAGLAWFLFSKSGASNGQSQSRPSWQDNSAKGSGSFTAARGTVADAASSAADGVRSAWNNASEAAADGLDSARQGLDQATQPARDLSQRAASGVSQGAASVASSAKAAGATVQEVASNSAAFVKEQPLVLLGLGVALGAAVGASLPATETEAKLMGEASQEAQNQVREAVDQQVDKARTAGEHVYDEISRAVKDEVRNLATENSASQDGSR